MNADASCQIMIGGDFNVHLNPILDNLGGSTVAKSSGKTIRSYACTRSSRYMEAAKSRKQAVHLVPKEPSHQAGSGRGSLDPESRAIFS